MISMLAPAGAGLFYLALGIAALVKPATLLSGFGLPAQTLDARNEVRAVYGGFPIAVAALVIWSLTGAEQAEGILLALAVASFGMALGRLVSAAIDGSIGRQPALFIGIELALAAMLAAGTGFL
jgi:hypothetical protein